jgi:hypothetical protein
MNIFETYQAKRAQTKALESLATQAISFGDGFFMSGLEGYRKLEVAAASFGISPGRVVQKAVSILNRGTQYPSTISLEAAEIAFQTMKRRFKLLENGKEVNSIDRTLVSELNRTVKEKVVKEDIIVALGVMTNPNPPV